MLYVMSFIAGIFVVLLWIALVLLSRSITTFFHEMGHAIPALLFTKAPVEVYIGSYGDLSKSQRVKIGRLSVFFKFDFLGWNIGLCRHQYSSYLITELIIILSGPLASLLVAGVSVWGLVAYGATESGAFILGVFVLSAIWDFLVNLYPRQSPFYLHDGGQIYSDGFQLMTLIKESRYPDAYFEARQKYQEGEYTAGIEILKGLLKEGHKHRAIYQLLRQSFEKNNQVREAISCYEDYYRQFKFQSSDYAELGYLFLQTGDYAQALKNLEQALFTDFQNARTLHWKGKALLGLGDFQQAMQALNASIHYQADVADAYRDRARVNIKIHQMDAAYEDLDRAMTLEPEAPLNSYYLGQYFEEKGMYEKALKHYEEAKQRAVDIHGIDFTIESVKRKQH